MTLTGPVVLILDGQLVILFYFLVAVPFHENLKSNQLLLSLLFKQNIEPLRCWLLRLFGLFDY